MSAATAVNGGDGPVKSPPVTGNSQTLKTAGTKAQDGARVQSASPVDNQNRKQTPKAWQGPNPITQRAPASTTNGTEKTLPKMPTQGHSGKSAGEIFTDKHAHDRSLFLFAQFVGKDASITLKNGEQFQGVFSGGSFESSKSQYILKMTRRTKAANHLQANGTVDTTSDPVGEGTDHTMTFDLQDTVDLFVQNVSTNAVSSQQNGSISSSFRTDTQISGRDPQRPREHELQRWEPGADMALDMSLEDSGGAGWDQFAANANLYGVESTYDENVYTTALDRSHPQYKQRQAAADRIAREIESSAPADAHVAEERQRDASRDEGGDEEDKYSGVRREAATLPRRAAGAYVPPSQRPITGAPTVPGAPFDPAIISSQISKGLQPTSSTSDSAQSTAPAVATPKVVTTGSPTAHEQQAAAAQTSTDAAAPEAAARKSREVTTEDHVRDTADAFKQFANNEKLRLRQAQEAKRSNLRQEKNVKLNDLKKFAENFKLKSRVPDDLVPILAKDREKQLEIKTKAEAAAKEEESRSKDKPSGSAAATSPTPSGVPSSAPSQTTAPALPDQRMPHSRARMQPQNRTQPPMPPYNPGPSPRGSFNQRVPPPQLFGRPNIPQPLPADLRIPVGPSNLPVDVPTSPLSATRLNVNAKAFEFRPAASTFTPSGSSPSPQRLNIGPDQPQVSQKSFFDQKKLKDIKDSTSSFDPLTRMAWADYADQQKKAFTANGGLPQAYSTPPVWATTKANEASSYLDAFPRASSAPTSSQVPSPMHTPNINGPMPPMHQMPPHFQPPSASTPPQRPYYPQQQQPGPPVFDPRLQQHPQYRMSPTMQYRLPHGQMPQQQFGGPPMMMHQPMQGPPPGPMPPQYQPPPMMPPPFVGQPPYRSPQPYRPMPGQPQYQQYMSARPLAQRLSGKQLRAMLR